MADLIDGKYRILRTIGEGAWGVVSEAENVRTLKRVAIKILRPRVDPSAETGIRFEREAQAAGRIGSEHIVEVFDVGMLADGTQFMVMELLRGEDLARRIQKSGPLSPITAAKIAVQLLAGLAAAHKSGILHRDLKPENLFLSTTRSGDDFVKILDFGISKFNDPGGVSATVTGAVLGSPLYMAPEQARGSKNVDARTDLYSVGALLFEAVTGHPPFSGDNFNDLMFKIVLSPRPNPIEFRPDLDPPFAAILTRAIAADPNERFGTAIEFRGVLLDWLDAQGLGAFQPPDARQMLRPGSERGGMSSARGAPSRRPPSSRHGVADVVAASARAGRSPPSRQALRTQESARMTPISSSAPLNHPAPPRAATAILGIGIGVAVAAVAAGGLALRRHIVVALHGPPAAASAEARAPAGAFAPPAPSMPAAAVAIALGTSSDSSAQPPGPPETPNAPSASGQNAPQPPPEPLREQDAAAESRSPSAPPARWRPTDTLAKPSPVPAASLQASAPAAASLQASAPARAASMVDASAPIASPAAAAPSPPAKPIGTVEGREFRTGL